jgi:hypothetical protein
LIEDLAKLKTSVEPQSTIFNPELQPTLWAFRADENSEPHSYTFGYPCGEYLCLVPLAEDGIEAERAALWAAPVCKNETDAKRMFFLVDQLLNALDDITEE